MSRFETPVNKHVLHPSETKKRRINNNHLYKSSLEPNLTTCTGDFPPSEGLIHFMSFTIDVKKKNPALKANGTYFIFNCK